MEYNMIMAYADGASVRGTPGLFYPADKARVDYLWQKIHAMDNSELSFAGDVEGFILENTVSGAHTAVLTVDGLNELRSLVDQINERLDNLESGAAEIDLDDVKSRIDDVKLRLDDFENTFGDFDVNALDARFNNLQADIDAVSDNQLSYFRSADFSTVDGSLIFFDGLGAHAFTLGGATWETYTVAGGGE